MADAATDPLGLGNLLRAEVAADPYPLYRRLRETAPVRRDGELDCWVLTRHADVMAALLDGRLSAARSGGVDAVPEEYREVLGPAASAMARQMLFLDPPDHTRLRGPVNRAFSPRVLEAIRPRIAAIVDELLGAVAGRGRMDVIADFALPLPAIVIAELLGVPAEDRERFVAWSDAFGSLLDDVGTGGPGVVVALEGVAEFIEYFRGLVSRRRRASADLLQGLIEARERGDALSEEELLGNLVLILAAGHRTTTHLIGNGLLALLRHPEQLGRLRADPSLGPRPWPSSSASTRRSR